MNAAGNIFLEVQEQTSADPLSALIAVAVITAVFVIFLLIKRNTSRPQKAEQQTQITEEPVEKSEAKSEPIHFYKPEEIGVDDGQLIAVLTAAIVAATGKSSSSFRVVSFRKKGDWAANALREQINK